MIFEIGKSYLKEVYNIESDDYTPMQNTDLYNKNSVCYCILLETISDYNIPV